MAISASSGAKRGKVSLGANDREGALVDRRAVLDVVAAGHHDACLKICCEPRRLDAADAGGRVLARLLFRAQQRGNPSDRGRGVVLCDLSDWLIAQSFEDERCAVDKAEQRQAIVAGLGATLGAA